MPKIKDITYLPAAKFVNWSGGVVRKLFFGLAPQGTYRLALNMNSNDEIGSLVSRLGTAIIGEQRESGGSCYGIGNYVRTQTIGNKLFAAFSDGSNNIIYDMIDGTKNLTGDTKELKTRFVTYLDSIARVNGTDACKAYDNSSWVTSGGAFDVGNMPVFDKVIEWKDRVYGALPNSDKLSFSSIADPTARTISWTDSTAITGTGFIMVSQEDGGGGITALEKVPGYLLIFKKRTMKRWDGSTTYPEDLVNQGVPTQECVCRGRELVYFINQKGIWITNGGYPVRISRPIQDFIDAISDFDEVSSWADDEQVHFSIGDITINDNTYSNVTLRYNIEDQTWDIRSYYNNIKAMAQYVDTDGDRWIVIGDDNGQTLVIDSGTTDYDSTKPKAILWTVEPNYLDFGFLGNIKKIQRMKVYSENISVAKALWRSSKRGADYKQVGEIKENVVDLDNPVDSISGNFIGFKFTGTTDSKRVTFIGFEFPELSTIIIENTKE